MNVALRPEGLDRAIAEATEALASLQRPDGEWCFELEADATIPAEYILLEHFLDEIDEPLEQELAVYLRRTQGEHGGWPLFHGGDFNMSATVKAYYALKIVGDDVDTPHMKRARAAILANGGAARANVFTRFALALFDQVPWHAVPAMPVEIMLLPRWSPFHIEKVSYWSRTVIVPLLALVALRPKAVNPRRVGIAELFVTPPDQEQNYQVNPTGSKIGEFFLALDKVVRAVEPWLPRKARKRAIDKAVAFIVPRLNGDDGLGGIFPAMANAVMMFATMGYAPEHPYRAIAKASVKKLLVRATGESYCQPCLSPVWDTVLGMQALMEAGADPHGPMLTRASDWVLGC
jgi:squalene-hopene/tetraprenyl-beta-curcumene cyclase